MSNNVLHTRFVAIDHCLAAIFEEELNVRRRRLIAVGCDDYVLILEAQLRHNIGDKPL